MALVCEFDLVSDVFGISETPELGIPIDYSEACGTFVRVFLDEAQDLVPVDTGNLLGSISGDTDEDGQIRVEAGADYAQYVEFGTYKMRAQPYFIPACQRAWAEAMPIAAEAIQEAMEEEEELLEEMEEEEEGNARQGSYMSGGGRGSYAAGSFAGAVAGGIIAGIIIGIINIFFDIITPGGNDSHGSISLGRHAGSDIGDAAESGSVESFIYIE